MFKPPVISFSTKSAIKHDTAVAFVSTGNKLMDAAEKLDRETDGQISAYLKRQKTFTGKMGQVLVLPGPAKGSIARIALLGIGDGAKTTHDADTMGTKLFASLYAAGAENVVVHADTVKKSGVIDGADTIAHLAMGMSLKSYRFDQYRSKKKSTDTKPDLTKVVFVAAASTKASKTFKHLKAVSDGVFLSKDLVNTPPNDLYPDSYAKRIRAELAPLGVKVQIMDEKTLKTKGFGAHLAVGQGSIRPPRLVVMHWNGLGEKSKEKPIAFVGKGITFDTGGISIKPAGGMDEMKMDMAGSAAVVGAMKALALRKAKAHVVGVVALAENMPGHNAYRPGDILKSLSGKTIEVLNTDAEGRLVLCDSLTYVQKTYKPKLVIDLATLTGAIIVSLGNEFCGSFVNDDKLWSAIDAAGKDVGEKFWRMPLDDAYRKDVESKVADLRNIGSPGKGGSCTAAAFLEAFIDDKMPWAHLDIAGTGMSSAGATGFGVRTLDRLISTHHEKR